VHLVIRGHLGYWSPACFPGLGQSAAGLSIQLTVETYGKRLPMGNKAAVDRLDGALPDGVVARGANAPRRREERLQFVGGNGAPRAIRTPDLQIRSVF
jgi:hypothetical protein